MRTAIVKMRGVPAGRLQEDLNGFEFMYFESYLNDSKHAPVSLTLPKQVAPHSSPVLFPFFYGLLAEGALKAEQCQQLKLDEQDHFGRLLQTTDQDTIGAVTVHQEEE